MLRLTLPAAILLLALNGALSGFWNHRWDAWTDSEIQTAVARIEGLPLQVGEWEGTPQIIDPLEHPVDQIGNGVKVVYRNRTDHSVVSVYLACGPTEGMIAHHPLQCYVAAGFASVPPVLRVSPGEGPAPQFWVASFTKPETATAIQLRVFWAWSDGSGWQVPENPRRTFRQDPVLYKCYFTRQLTTTEEPIEGDPCLRLMNVLLPRMDAMLAGKS